MVQIAILGYGIVGSGVLSFIEANRERLVKQTGKEVRVRRILDARDFDSELLTHNISDILDDTEISIVVESLGGLEPAYTYVKAALQKGKSVCTSNKELVAAHGSELLAIAEANSVSFMFEASVGGGIPVILPLDQNLMLGELTAVTGILNGTTNYILSRMHNHGLSFDAALKEAQQNGYAERDPSADVEGFDAARKLAILLSIIVGRKVDYRDIPTTGITSITAADFARAAELNKTIKLLCTAKIKDDKVFARVAPFMLETAHPLANVHNEYNAVMITSSLSADMLFYGKGAGMLPTAGAVVADVAACIMGNAMRSRWIEDKQEIIAFDGPFTALKTEE